MRTPEEVAREIECERSRDECINHSMDWPCNDSSVRYVAEAIRARDAEVWAEALAGLTYESCGTNRLGQPTGRWVGPVQVEP